LEWEDGDLGNAGKMSHLVIIEIPTAVGSSSNVKVLSLIVREELEELDKGNIQVPADVRLHFCVRLIVSKAEACGNIILIMVVSEGQFFKV
jgi:hypothetical protein